MPHKKSSNFLENPEYQTNLITKKPQEISEESQEDNTVVEERLSGENEATNCTRGLKLIVECQEDFAALNFLNSLYLHVQDGIFEKCSADYPQKIFVIIHICHNLLKFLFFRVYIMVFFLKYYILSD